MSGINPNMIMLAREARGMTQQMLAEKINSNKTNISRLEKGDALATPDTIDAISGATGFPPQFFYQPGDMLPSNLAYRKRQQVPAKIMTPIEAQSNILRIHAELLTTLSGIPAPDLPVYTLSEKITPAQAASMLRRDWQITEPVIPDMTGLLESRHILIHSFDFGTGRVDSKSILTTNRFPVIFLNASLLGDRQRFSLAYELGHLLMHSFTDVSHERNIGHEANAFAAELLMPAADILPDLEKGITLPLLGELKKKWKVSMIALVYRADDLGLLTPNQKRYLIQQFNQLNIRRREPPELDIAAEKPSLIHTLTEQYRQRQGLGMTEMAALLSLEIGEYMELYTAHNN